MGFSLYNLFKAGLLVANAVTVLNPKRFLKKCELRISFAVVRGPR